MHARAFARAALVAAAAASLAAPRASAQTTPFLTDRDIQIWSNELSGDRAYEHIRWLTHWHRDSGMEGFFKAAEYVQQAAKDAGLQDVRFVEQRMDAPNYTARSAELWLVEPVEVKLGDIGDHNVYLADGSHDADVTAELVWVGDASPEALSGVNVAGKIVLTSAGAGTAATNAVWGKGAAGVISYQPSESKSTLDFPDQIAWQRVSVTPPEGKRGTFAFSLPPRKGEALRRLLGGTAGAPQDWFMTGRKTPGGRAVVRARVDTDIGTAPGRTGFVEGVIRGSKYHDQAIVLTAHLQEEKGSANDDGSGCANLLEIARTWNKLIAEGKVPRPLRDIRFWWTDEISSEYRYFRDNPEVPTRILANVHQDMVGANQALGSRVQHLILAPHSRTSYLDAVFASIASYLILTNNGFLASSRQGGLPRPFTRPIYSTRGSRQGYNARFVPFFSSSDHMTFLDGPIGVPAVATINWDDPYIHSSDDDLWQVDATQLQRNAFLIGTTAYVLAYADADRVPLFAAEVYAQGASRLANDLEVAMRAIDDTTRPAEARWADALAVHEQAFQREARALASVRVFAPGSGTAGASVDRFASLLRTRESQMLGELSAYFEARSGRRPASSTPSPAEQAARARIPSNVMPLETYFSRRDGVQVPAGNGLHGLMRYEAYNFVDGKRSYFDIYRALRAEQLAAGEWYYGTVKLEDVVSLLDAAAKAGVLTVRGPQKP